MNWTKKKKVKNQYSHLSSSDKIKELAKINDWRIRTGAKHEVYIEKCFKVLES